LVAGQSLVYYSLLLYTVLKHNQNIRRSNVWLLWSWAAETTIRLVLVMMREAGYSVNDAFWLVWTILSVSNYVWFNLTMFKLKAIAVYMDEENEREVDIKAELSRLQYIRFAFALMNALLLLSGPV
jgi:hypothetical protein